jgi:hypothetical protein
MTGLLLKAMAIWLVILVMAIVNVAIREKLLTPAIGSGLALPASGLILSVIIFLVAYTSVPFFGSTKSKAYIAVGIVWFALTLCFEFGFGHFIAGKPWLEILEVFNVTEGNLFFVALLVTLIAPWLSANARNLI